MSKEFIRPEQFAKADLTAVLNDAMAMSPEQVQELAALYEGTLSAIQPGKLISGTIINVDSDGVLVDINYKSYGLIPRYEFGDHELAALKVGDSIEVLLDQLEDMAGSVVLSYEKAKELRAWSVITKLFEENKPAEGIVTHKVKGGLNVDIGIPAFLPGSQIDLHRVIDFDHFVGQTITASILKINKKRGNVIISRRKYLSEQRSEVRKKILDTLSTGQVLQGTVKNITNYGVFIDIGGVDGLLHITDMTWGRIAHPSELVSIGDNITVKVLSFDKDNEKISLGTKQLSENPWDRISNELVAGSRAKGTISSVTDYGLFVELRPGIEGLVHISEISWTNRITDISKKFKVGSEIEVLVVSVDKENKRISLSIKQLEKNPWETIDQYCTVGQKIKGTISNITDFGIFVRVAPGIDGLVHISDLSWTEHIDHPGDIYKQGDEIEAVVLGIDKDNKKISLGIKQLSEDPWSAIETQYAVGNIIEGEVSKTTNFGAFIKLASGIEGLVHISELSDQPISKVEDVLKVGQKVKLRVINVDKNNRKLGLSLKLEDTKKTREEAPAQQHAPRAAAPERREQKQHHRERESQQQAPKLKSTLQLELEKHRQANAENADTTKDESAE